MISQRRFNKERLLYGTLLETLILFLFILLAIASIYQKSIRENNLVGPGEVAVKESVYEAMEAKVGVVEKIQDTLENLNVEKDLLVAKKDSLEDQYEYIKGKMRGIQPPPCQLQSKGKKIILVDFMHDSTFVIQANDLDEDIVFKGEVLVEKYQWSVLTIPEFNQWARRLHDSKKINENSPDCAPDNPKAWTSAFCYECKYAYEVADLAIGLAIVEEVSALPVPKNLTRYMEGIVRQYFY